MWHRIDFRDRIGVPPIVGSVRPAAGEVILCLHGLQGRGAIFAALASDPRLVGHRLLAVDFPGFGESAARGFPGDPIEAFVDDIRGVARSLGIDRCHIVGHSLGGMVGTLLLGEAGLRVLSLVNLEGNLTRADCGASAAVAEMSQEAFCDVGFEEMLRGIAAEGGASAFARLDAIRRVPPETFHATSRSIVNWSDGGTLLDRFVHGGRPRCLVVGERNVAKLRVLPAAIPHLVVPDSGHFMLLDNPAASMDVIAGWIGALRD